MLLRDLTVYADPEIVDRFPGGFVQRFHRENCAVVELYLSLLHRKVNTDGIAKVQLVFSDMLVGVPHSGWCENLGSVSVIVLKWRFDFTSYCEADEWRRKVSTMEALHQALRWLAAHRGWQSERFDEAYQMAYERHLQFEGFGKRSWVAPGGKYRVRIFFSFRPKAVVLFAALFDGRGKRELARQHLADAIPESACLNSYLTQGEWTSPTTFRVESSDFRASKWSVDFSEVMAESRTESSSG